MNVPTLYRKTDGHRKLWATMKFLAKSDTSCPILKGEYDREIVKAAVDRRRTILEHETSDEFRAYFQIERAYVIHAVKSSGGKNTEKWVGMALGSLKPDLTETLGDAWKKSIGEWATFTSGGPVPAKKAKADPVASYLKRNLGVAVKGISEGTRLKLAAALVAGEKKGYTLQQQAKQIDKLYLQDIIPNRSMTIARTEVGRATNWTQFMLAQDADVPMEKEWLALDDDRTRDTHAEADGQRVDLEDPFQVGDNELMYPGDPDGDPEEVINCRCSVLHHVIEDAPQQKAETPEEFAKSVLGVDNPDVITSLAFMKGVFTEQDDWVESRDTLMGHVYRLRRNSLSEVEKYSPDQPRDENGQWSDSGRGGGAAPVGDPSDRPEIHSHLPEAQRERVLSVEKELLARNVGARGGRGKERLVIIRPDGSVLLDKEGSANHVPLTGSEVHMLAAAGDAVGTHNHPANVTISPQDCEVAWTSGLTEIRAVGNDYTFSMKPQPGKKWPNRLVLHAMSRQHLDPLSKAAQAKAEELFGAEREKVDRTDPKSVKAFNKKVMEWNLVENARIQHEAWLKAAPLLSLEYTRTKNKGAK